MPIIGLEPSCLLTLRDELLSLRNDDAAKSVSAHAVLFEEFLVREAEAGRLKLPLGPLKQKALLHGHCHQKSFGAFKPVEKVLRLVPGSGGARPSSRAAAAWPVRSAMARTRSRPRCRWPNCRCCRRSGSAEADDLIVADGISCRHQIADGAGRDALHVARVLEMSLDSARDNPYPSAITKEPIHG